MIGGHSDRQAPPRGAGRLLVLHLVGGQVVAAVAGGFLPVQHQLAVGVEGDRQVGRRSRRADEGVDGDVETEAGGAPVGVDDRVAELSRWQRRGRGAGKSARFGVKRKAVGQAGQRVDGRLRGAGLR